MWSKAVPTAEAEAVAEYWRGCGVAVQVQEPEGGASLVHVCPEADELVPALESEGFVRDEDVLDTWFSSRLVAAEHDGLARANSRRVHPRTP